MPTKTGRPSLLPEGDPGWETIKTSMDDISRNWGYRKENDGKYIICDDDYVDKLILAEVQRVNGPDIKKPDANWFRDARDKISKKRLVSLKSHDRLVALNDICNHLSFAALAVLVFEYAHLANVTTGDRTTLRFIIVHLHAM